MQITFSSSNTCRSLYFGISFFLGFLSVLSQNTGQITGIVTDERSAPVAGASVYLEGTSIGTQSDFDGNFTIDNVEPGSYNIIASYIGYESQTRFNFIVRSKGTPQLNFVLVEAAESLDEVVIDSSNKISRPRETPLSTQTLSAVEIATYPGSNNDVVQVAQTLPGVSPSVGGFRNDLIIRGGAPNETVYYLDGMEIPNINHFATQGSAGGPVGLINVSFIDNVTLSTSAFGAQYDNPLSGVLQFSQRQGSQDGFRGNFRISASEAALTLEGPLLKKDGEMASTTYLVSVRRSYLQFLFGLIGLPFRPNYWDYQYKIDHQIDTHNSLSLIGIGSIDDFTLEAPDDPDEGQQAQLDQAPFIDQRTNAIGLTWKHRFKDGSGFMQTTLSNNTLNNEFSRYRDSENQQGLYFNNDAVESETKLRWQATRFSGEWKFTGGVNLQYSDYSNNTLDLIGENAYSTQIDFVKYGLNLNATRSFFNDTFDVSFGFRMDDDSFTDKDNLLSTFSPRLSLSYEFIEDWRVNATVGRYFKLPPYTILGYRDPEGLLTNRDVNYTRSDHYVLGVQHYFNPSSSISVEGFYKYYDNYPVSVRDGVSLANKGAGFEVLGNEEIVTDGRGRSYGAEFLFEQKLTGNFYGILSYTWFYSEFTGFDREVFLPSVWDSRHLLSFVGGYKLKRNWEVSARYRFAGETPFVPVDQDATLANYPEIILDYGRLGEEKLGIFSQLDLRIDKRWDLQRLSLNIFIEAQNVLSQDIPQPPEFGLSRDAGGQITEPRTLTQLERDSGQIIPSIGVVVDF
jgi:outer membrane receptor for ferrienterochelin and colicin